LQVEKLAAMEPDAATVEPYATACWNLILHILKANATLWNKYRPQRVRQVLDCKTPESTFQRLKWWPLARVAEHSAQTIRKTNASLRAAYLREIITVFKMWPDRLIPCEICCQATGSWCEGCDNPNHAVCGACERDGEYCHDCCHPRPPEQPREDAVYAYQPEGYVPQWAPARDVDDAANPFAEYFRQR
jgi:hypothetical protein